MTARNVRLLSFPSAPPLVRGSLLPSFFPSCPSIALTGAGRGALCDVFFLTITAHNTLSRSLLLGIRLGIVLSQVINFILSSSRACARPMRQVSITPPGNREAFSERQVSGSSWLLVSSIGCFLVNIAPPSRPSSVDNRDQQCNGQAGMEWAFVAMILGRSSAGLLQAYSSGRRGRSREEVKGEDEKT